MKNRSRLWTIVALIGIVLFVALRVWRLGTPVETVFDEVYFPKMASQYLNGESFFDIHPPLGKLIIAVGEILFGNTPIGWRVMPLLAGIGLLPAGYWAMKQLFGNEDGKRAGLIAALLLAMDGLLIVYSRTGLMDGFILLFGILSIGFCWQFIHARETGNRGALSMLLTGIFAGLALAVKWIGVGFLPLVAGTILIALFFQSKRSVDFADFQLWFLSFVLVPFLLYTLPFLANWQTDFWHQFALWHQQSWDYNVHLDATHPYSSKWWSWPFLVRPIWFYYQGQNNVVVGVDGIGNPLEWWASTLAVVYSILAIVYTALVELRAAVARIKAENQILTMKQLWPVLFLLAGWAAFFLPWAVIGRVLFLYHYLTSYVFALLLMAFWLGMAWKEKYNWLFVTIVLAAMIGSAFIFMPIWIAYPISQNYFNWLMWFKSWI